MFKPVAVPHCQFVGQAALVKRDGLRMLATTAWQELLSDRCFSNAPRKAGPRRHIQARLSRSVRRHQIPAATAQLFEPQRRQGIAPKSFATVQRVL
jgi:hypothetical protein